MSLNWRMDKESVAHVHIRVLLSRKTKQKKNDDILNFVCKRMEVENTILSKITQTQKYEYGMYSRISGF